MRQQRPLVALAQVALVAQLWHCALESGAEMTGPKGRTGSPQYAVDLDIRFDERAGSSTPVQVALSSLPKES